MPEWVCSSYSLFFFELTLWVADRIRSHAYRTHRLARDVHLPLPVFCPPSRRPPCAHRHRARLTSLRPSFHHVHLVYIRRRPPVVPLGFRRRCHAPRSPTHVGCADAAPRVRPVQVRGGEDPGEGCTGYAAACRDCAERTDLGLCEDGRVERKRVYPMCPARVGTSGQGA
jgi:hypothetical protein